MAVGERDESGDSGVVSAVRDVLDGSLRARLGVTEDQNNLMGFLFVAPNVLMFSVFLLGPVLYAFYISFQEWSILRNAGTWVGLANYVDVLTPLPVQGGLTNLQLNTSVFTDPSVNLFWYSLKTTVIYAVGTVPLQIYGGLAVALMLDKRVRMKKAYRAAYFMPVMLSGAASAVMWRWFLAADGVINNFLEPIGELVGVQLAQNWAGNPSYALGGVMLMAIWGGIGSNMIFFLAGLQNVPEELYEAARIDGASAWQRFRHVTWPNLGNTNFFVIVMAIIGAFQVFGIALVYSEGGPVYATTTIVLLIYQRAFEEGKMGVGAAMAFILFLIIFAFSYHQYRHRQQEEVTY
ncbi:multiple sugar transport system permease protein [Halogranum rubrum]|uniref:Multiple sugar transport system permease protein n=1 Tax=Halogranum rubrum TaxID=553466 RepID=A0A1I4GRV2_9EURY|nr:sugar ABC transporter permease [Halogranum rubrum]SFL31836.1 multiple sugar transport system permease protein [Halogranum rubrum]